jgi:hypothetical protein
MEVLLLAVVAAIYPTLLAVVVILLRQPNPKRLLLVYFAAGIATSIAIGLAIVFAIEGVVDSSTSTPSVASDLVVGGLLLLSALVLATHADVRFSEKRRKRRGTAVRAWHRRKVEDEAKEPWSERLASRGSLPLLFLAGIVMNLPGAAYLIALKDIAAAHHPDGTKVLLIVLFNVIMFLVAEVPIVGLTIAPERTHELLSELNLWVSGHGREIATVLCLGLGGFLVVRGLVHA